MVVFLCFTPSLHIFSHGAHSVQDTAQFTVPSFAATVSVLNVVVDVVVIACCTVVDDVANVVVDVIMVVHASAVDVVSTAGVINPVFDIVVVVDTCVADDVATITLANAVSNMVEAAGSAVVDATVVVSLSRPDDTRSAEVVITDVDFMFVLVIGLLVIDNVLLASCAEDDGDGDIALMPAVV